MMAHGYESDVIAAISTPHGVGAVGIVRLSGDGVMDVFGRIFRANFTGTGHSVKSSYESHRMYYGQVCSGGEVVDEVMACCMLAPRSYTREDTVEIYAHGGMATLYGVLNAALSNGARLALPGEFTKRAFLNGRINLTQAEAVMDLISASSNAARRAGLRQLGGGLSNRIAAARDKLLLWLANIELSIDYPEHEDEAMNRSAILTEADNWLADMQALCKTADVGRILRDGIKTAILGRPNVGKSTLLNAVLGEDRAIVHEIPGTTRDVLTERVQLGDVVLQLMDTAGIRETNDPIESIGVTKTYQAAQDAELVIYVMDRSKPPMEEDLKILDRLEAGLDESANAKDGGHVIVVLNKCDLPPASGWDTWQVGSGNKCNNHTKYPIVHASAQNRDGLENLYETVNRSFLKGQLAGVSAQDDIITRERHKELLQAAISHVRRAVDELRAGTVEDLVAIGLREAYTALGEVLGLEVSDDIVDRIFSEFCVGK
ncbi:MAG: tRNA uridine-5-carboxymethylaminomethyl(34) synthesis GTPase MnmE [Defluviitaleaceae bacterium]|nr:tRNA uridine-5-carboxymethylaminomethyl(34) synthesis GTPase MnmE [Defluviitaleaceae bacterium]